MDGSEGHLAGGGDAATVPGIHDLSPQIDLSSSIIVYHRAIAYFLRVEYIHAHECDDSIN